MAIATAAHDVTVEYLRVMDDGAQTTVALGSLEQTLVKIHRKLYAAVKPCCAKYSDAGRVDVRVPIHQFVSADILGGERQAVRILENYYYFQAVRVSMRATSKVIAMRCGSINEAPKFLSAFRVHCTLMGTGEDRRRTQAPTALKGARRKGRGKGLGKSRRFSLTFFFRIS